MPEPITDAELERLANAQAWLDPIEYRDLSMPIVARLIAEFRAQRTALREIEYYCGPGQGWEDAPLREPWRIARRALYPALEGRS